MRVSKSIRAAATGAAVAALTLGALGVAPALAQDASPNPSNPTVYVIAPSLTDPFWITEQNGANQAGKDFGVNVIFQAPAQDTGDAGMASMAEAAIGAKPD